MGHRQSLSFRCIAPLRGSRSCVLACTVSEFGTVRSTHYWVPARCAFQLTVEAVHSQTEDGQDRWFGLFPHRTDVPHATGSTLKAPPAQKPPWSLPLRSGRLRVALGCSCRAAEEAESGRLGAGAAGGARRGARRPRRRRQGTAALRAREIRGWRGRGRQGRGGAGGARGSGSGGGASPSRAPAERGSRAPAVRSPSSTPPAVPARGCLAATVTAPARAFPREGSSRRPSSQG
jgi:hypothetical protein